MGGGGSYLWLVTGSLFTFLRRVPHAAAAFGYVGTTAALRKRLQTSLLKT